MNRIQELVEQLELTEHPEGGFYKETYRSAGSIPQDVLGDIFTGERNYSTGIYFLLTTGNFSAFHRIRQDEMWHFYEGDPLIIHMIDQAGKYSTQEIGLNLHRNQLPQFVVPKNIWFASEVLENGTYSLVGCTVSPGFDFEDFELAKRDQFINNFPQHEEIIQRLTRA